MTPSVFMTIEALEEKTPNMVKILRNINQVVAANPQWYMIEIIDGFGDHLGSVYSLELR